MGVDYTGHYGFGVKIIRNEEEYFLDWIYEKCETNEDIYYFEVGEGNYTGDENDIFVCINVEDQIDKDNGYKFLEYKAEELYEFLRSIGLEYEGVANIVGGLEIY